MGCDAVGRGVVGGLEVVGEEWLGVEWVEGFAGGVSVDGAAQGDVAGGSGHVDGGTGCEFDEAIGVDGAWWRGAASHVSGGGVEVVEEGGGVCPFKGGFVRLGDGGAIACCGGPVGFEGLGVSEGGIKLPAEAAGGGGAGFGFDADEPLVVVCAVCAKADGGLAHD